MIAKKVYEILTGSTGVTTIVNDSIFRIETPQSTESESYIPSIVYETTVTPVYNNDTLISNTASIDMLLTHYLYDDLLLLTKEVRKSLECIRFEDAEIKINDSKIDRIEEDTLTKENNENDKIYLKGIQLVIKYINK